jgi:hypothetical protein
VPRHQPRATARQPGTAPRCLAGILPLGAAGFLGWIIVGSIQAAPWPQRWSLAGIIAVGVILMLIAQFVLRSPFFQTPRESA